MVDHAPTVFPGCPHHVTQRGNRRHRVFLDAEDRSEFAHLLRAAAAEARVGIWAHVLLSNHFHLVAVPEDPESLALAMERGLSAYAAAFRRRHRSSDEVWHKRFHATVIAPRYLWDIVRYVERNPVRAGIVVRAEEYPWSSAAYHCGLRSADPLVSPGSPLKDTLGDWSAWLAEPDRDGRLAFLRRRALEREAGSASRFIGTLEHLLDRKIAGGKRRRGRRKGKGA